jgi:guanine nucleotide-binding protein subunit beta-2-like 1 protein
LILAAGAEKKVRLYNTLGECKHVTDKNNHTEWVSRVRFSPQKKSSSIQPYFVTVGWDGWLRVFNLNFTVRFAFKAHENFINAVDISPLFGNLIATGGKDKKLFVWDISDLKKPRYEFDAGATIHAVLFIKYSLDCLPPSLTLGCRCH